MTLHRGSTRGAPRATDAYRGRAAGSGRAYPEIGDARCDHLPADYPMVALTTRIAFCPGKVDGVGPRGTAAEQGPSLETRRVMLEDPADGLQFVAKLGPRLWMDWFRPHCFKMGR